MLKLKSLISHSSKLIPPVRNHSLVSSMQVLSKISSSSASAIQQQRLFSKSCVNKSTSSSASPSSEEQPTTQKKAETEYEFLADIFEFENDEAETKVYRELQEYQYTEYDRKRAIRKVLLALIAVFGIGLTSILLADRWMFETKEQIEEYMKEVLRKRKDNSSAFTNMYFWGIIGVNLLLFPFIYKRKFTANAKLIRNFYEKFLNSPHFHAEKIFHFSDLNFCSFWNNCTVW